jgi:coproporphyrinogen III oxidase-like Fe-S oxidoreductase
MRRNQVLEDRLIEWGKEYGGGKYENVGRVKSWLGAMVFWGGRTPSGLGQVQLNTAADAVQEAVVALAQQTDGFVPACVIKCEYFSLEQPWEIKQSRMEKVGQRTMARNRYSEHLRIARVHVAAWLHIPFCELEDAA